MSAGPSPDGGDEARLIVAARAGDSAALSELLAAHYDRMYSLCRRMVGEADADDATQDAMVAVVRAIGRFDGRSALGTWLYRIAANTCLDELRRRRRRPAVGYGDDVADSARDHPAGGWTGRASSPDPAEMASNRVDIDAALAALLPEFRLAVVLRDLCDLSYEEIAAVVEVPVGTVRSRIAHGRGVLADLLGNDSGSGVVQPLRAQNATTEEPRS